jgi:hypothetical protein
LPGMTVNAKDKYLIADMIPINLTMMPASGSGYRGGCKRPVSSRAILATPGNNRAKTPARPAPIDSDFYSWLRPIGEKLMRHTKFIAGAVVMACALAGVTAASAADMAPRMYTKAPIPVVIYDWTGFYIGGNLGYSWGRAGTDGTQTGTQGVSVFRTAVAPQRPRPS